VQGDEGISMATILIVDDDADIRMALRESLTDAGHFVCEAADGEQAVEEAVVYQPNAVILDITMPGIDGFATLKELKAQPATHEIPVLMLTASSGLYARERARVLGAFDYIEKPWIDGEVQLRTEWALAAEGNPARRKCMHPELDPAAA
jgi:CheY-like chemotaxis protein